MEDFIMEPETEESFVIDNDQLADWAVRKIAEADAELEKMDAWYKTQLQIAHDRHDKEVSFFASRLQKYMDLVPVKDTKTTRKYALPSGELVLSKEKQDFSAVDTDALLGWCQENDPALVSVVMKPAWADIKKRLTMTDSGVVDQETGMIVEGVELITKPAEFKVKVKGEKQ